MLELKKKTLAILAILISLNTFANDNNDMRFINRLYQNKDYKLTVEELNKFIVRYPRSKHYNDAQLILGKSLYELKEYQDSITVFQRLVNTNHRNEVYYYLALASIELDLLSDAHRFSRELRDLSREIILFQLAIKEYKNDNMLKAREYFEELRSLRGTYRSIALFNLGLISYNIEAYKESTIYLEEYIGLEKEDIEKLATSNYILAFSYNKLNNKAKALEHYKNIESSYRTSTYYHLALRDLYFYFLEEKNNRLIEDYAKKLRGTRFEELVLMNTGNYFYNLSLYSKAVEYYKELADKSATNIDATYYLGRSYLYLDKKDEALREFNKLSKVSKYKNEYYYYTSFILFQQGKFKEVVNLLDEIENKVDKDLVNYYQLIGDSAYELKDYQRAQKYYALLFREKKTKDDFYRYYFVSSLVNDTKTLEELFEQYKKNYPRDKDYATNVYLTLGNLYANSNQPEKAINIYTEGLKQTNDPILLENLVLVQTRLRKFEEALATLQRLESTPERDYQRALLLLSLKRYVEASNVLEALSRKQISNELKERVYIRLAEIYLLDRKYTKTIETVEKYEALNKTDNKEILSFKAIAYFRLEQYNKARAVYERSLNIPEEKASSYYMIAETYYNERNYNDAKINYLKAIEYSKDINITKDSEYWLIRVEEMLGDKNALLERAERFRKKYPKSEYEEDIEYLIERVLEEDVEKEE